MRSPRPTARFRNLARSLMGLLIGAAGCGEPCWVVPTWVELETPSTLVRVPGSTRFTAVTVLGFDACGTDPTEVVGYRWWVNGEPVEVGNTPHGAELVLHFATPGRYEVEVRVEDNLGAELPNVGHVVVHGY